MTITEEQKKKIVDMTCIHMPKIEEGLVTAIMLDSVYARNTLSCLSAVLLSSSTYFKEYKKRVNELVCNDDLEDALDLFYPEES